MRAAAEHCLSVLAFLVLVAAPVPLGLGVAAMSETDTRQRSTMPYLLLVVLAVWCVTQAFIAHLLALLHQLGLRSVLLAEVLVCAAGVVQLRRSRVHFIVSERLGALAAADALTTLVLLAVGFMGTTLLWWSAAMPVVDWDSWAFHMPHMAEWLQSGTFTRMAQGAQRARNSYPFGWEALCTLFLMPFGEDVLVTFPNLVAWTLLGLATYLLGRLWNAERTHALACSACVLAIHYVADAVNTMHVDMPFAALFMTTAYCGARWIRRGDRIACALGCATMGLACATRVTGPIYALLLAAWLPLARAVRLTPTRGTLVHPPVLAGVIAGLLLACFWYAKNLVQLGHPLGPGMPVAGPASVPGTWTFFAAHTLAFTFNPLHVSDWKALSDRTFGELDAPFIALVALTGLWSIARVRANATRAEESAAALTLLLVMTAVWFYITPLSAISGAQVRLGIPFLAMLGVTAAIGATRAELSPVVSTAFVWISAVRSFSGSRILFVFMLLAAVWGVWRRRPLQHDALRRRRPVVAVAGLLLFIMLAALARGRRERERRTYYGPFYAYLEDHVRPTEPVAYLLGERPYLLFGRQLARPLVFAPLDVDESVEDWAAQLRQRGVHIVAVGPWNDKDTTERTTVERLAAGGAALHRVVGSGQPGDVSLYELR